MSVGNVLGGITSPVFYSLDDNYITNPYFNQDVSGWTEETTPGILTRDIKTEAYGEYMGNNTSSNEYVQWSKTLSATPSNRTFMVSFRAMGDTVRLFDVEVIAEGTGGGSELFITDPALQLNLTIDRYFLIGSVPITAFSGTFTVKLRIHPNSAVASETIWFDHVYFSEVFETIALNLPLVQSGDPDQIKFEKIVRGRNELWSGAIQEFGKKWRPNYLGKWDYLDASFELARQGLSEASRLFLVPHSDVNWGFHCIWDDDFFRRYALGRYIEHKGSVKLRGMEFVHSHPTQFSSSGGVGIENVEV